MAQADKVAIITGAGGAIGGATAVELRRLGYRVALVGRTKATLAQVQARIGESAMVVAADVSSSPDATRAVAAVRQAWGRIDALVYAAGYAPLLTVERTSDEEWHKTIDTNLSGAFYMSRAAWPSLVEAAKDGQGAAIVNVSSEAARNPFSGFVAYAPAKAGLNMLTLALAREGAEAGIRAYAVAPGAVETPMLRKIVTVEQYPSHRTLAPADVARVIAQCVAGDLRYASGEVIYVHKT